MSAVPAPNAANDPPARSPRREQTAKRGQTPFLVGATIGGRCGTMRRVSNPPIRLAMWSGPRNISTALMRSWEARADTSVCDEPLYAHYLAKTGFAHPGAAEVLAHHEQDWRVVVESLAGPVPGGAAVFYQKHMSHHLLPDIDTEWVLGLTNCFLIREPREMLTSLLNVLPDVTLSDTGLPQQVALFDRVRAETGAVPPVLDGRAVLENPAGQLAALCARVGLPWDPAMLSWAAGSRPTDGIWAKHWYRSVVKTTGFGPYTPKPDVLPDDRADLLAECQSLYDQLADHQLVNE